MNISSFAFGTYNKQQQQQQKTTIITLAYRDTLHNFLANAHVIMNNARIDNKQIYIVDGYNNNKTVI